MRSRVLNLTLTMATGAGLAMAFSVRVIDATIAGAGGKQ
jgi:hypothetical protein